MSMANVPTFRGLPVASRIYIPGVFGLAAVAVVAEMGANTGTHFDPALLALALALCAAGNLYEVFAPAHFSFQPNLIIFLGASLLLPPWAVAALAVVCFVPGWLVHRFRWYMVGFNIANYTLAGTVAHAIVSLNGSLGSHWSPDLASTAAFAGAALAFVVINHALIVLVVTLAQGRSLRKSVEDILGCVPMDSALAMTGACLAALWAFAPPLALLAAGPMALVYRALWVPLLEHKSRTDSKTGLYNSEYLAKELEDALASAKRGGSGLTVVMIDLDQLRVINNRHGHLAGDKLIRAAADVLSDAATDHNGIAARFGGDELCMLLPRESLEPGRQIAEQVRAGINDINLPFDGSSELLAITASVGVASYPEHAGTVEGLLAAADVAVYDAKLGGRNRTRMALPPAAREALKLEFAERASQNGPSAAPHEAGERAVNGNPPEEAPEPVDEPATPAARPRLIAAYVGALCAGAVLVGALSSYAAIPSSPWLFALLVGSVVLLDAMRIDVFERANLSPAAVPQLALAFFFGPLGPMAAEGVIALSRLARGVPLLKAGFDFGALSLAGAGAAATFGAFPDPSSGLLLGISALAGATYYVVNSSLLAIVMGLAEIRRPLAVWRERLAWMVPHYVAFGLLAGTFVISELALGLYVFAVFGLPLLMLWIAEKQYLDRSRATVTELRLSNDELEAANARLLGLLEENQQLLGRMQRSYVSTITSLARTVEAKDPYTSGHTERVAEVALLLARQLGFDESDLPAINVGAIIHDIGKIGTPDQILSKPGALNAEEIRQMRKHPEMASYIVAELELPPAVKQMVRSHHERFDGDGYPDGLVGEEIPLAARILSVADALDAMTSDRPYRDALPLDVACAEIQDKAGTQFCPRVVAALMKSLSQNRGFWAEFSGAAVEPESTGLALR
jgi:diguanylate cyclase (GGDEF)-like protein/putative nucleotidyltransferase with HDIG domain